MLQTIKLENFRNHQLEKVTIPEEGLVITGPNGVGKTNLLEAIYLTSIGRSFRAPDNVLIKQDHNYYRVESKYDDTIVSISYSNYPASQQKIVKIADKKKSIHSLIGLHPVVLFEPNQTQLFHYTPTERRRYIDSILAQTDPQYLSYLRLYKRLIRMRNKLYDIYPWGANEQEQHMIYTIELSDPITYIINTRQQLLAEMVVDLGELYSSITKTTPTFRLSYIATLDTEVDILEQYQSSLSAEQRAKRTLLGPHRDDYKLFRDDVSIQSSASRGELRAIILALKYAECRYIKQKLERNPLLLFDDVLSEFDLERKQNFLKTNFGGQLIITTTDVPKSLSHYEVLSL